MEEEMTSPPLPPHKQFSRCPHSFNFLSFKSSLAPRYRIKLTSAVVILVLATHYGQSILDTKYIAENERAPVALIGIAVLSGTGLLNGGAQSDDGNLVSIPTIAIAIALCIQYGHLLFKVELVPQKFKIPAIAATFLFFNGSHELRNDGVYRQSIAWALLAVLFFMYGHILLGQEALPDYYRTPTLIIAAFLFLGGPSILPQTFSASYHVQATLLALAVQYGPSFINVGSYSEHLEYVILGLAFFFGPSMGGTGTIFEPYLQWIILSTLGLFSILAATTNIAGPLRYGYKKRKEFLKEFCEAVPEWTYLPLRIMLFHPWTSWCILGSTICIGWQYARENHREAVSTVAAEADNACSRASSLSTLAQAEARAAERHEHQAQNLAAAATRDARAAYNIRIIDFYEESAVAWAKMSDYTNAVGEAVEKSRQLENLARDLRFKHDQISASNSTDRAKIRDVMGNCGEVVNEVTELEKDGKKIRDKVERFKRAAQKGTDGRNNHVTTVEAHAKAMEAISSGAQTAAERASETTLLADSISQQAVKAKGLVAVGDKEKADTELKELKENLKECEKKYRAAVQARKGVQGKMKVFHEFTHPKVDPDPDPEGDETPGIVDEDSGDDE